MQSKQEMEAVRQRYEQSLSEGEAHNSRTEMDQELDEAKKLLENARDEERRAKLNLERVLQDNYLREEEILKLNRLLLQQKEKDELEIWRTKERFDECLVQTLEERDAEIIELKKKVEELELKIAAQQTPVNDTKALELIFQDDLEALQLERNALRQANEKYVRLISDYVRTSVFLEQRTNSQLSSSGSSSRTTSGLHHSPVSGQHNKGQQLSDVSADEQASSVASTTDEGLEVSRCFADGLFSGSDFDTECEEAAKEASISIQRSFDRLLDALVQSVSHVDDSQKLRDSLQSTETTNKDLMDLCEELQLKLQQECTAVTRLNEQLRVKEELQPKKRDDESELISSLYRTVEDLEHRLNETKQSETDLQKKNRELEQIVNDFKEVREDEVSMQTKFYEQLILISSLKSQLDEQKLMTNEYIQDAKNVLRWKEAMEQEKESSEAKDKMISDLKKEVTEMEEQIIDSHVELDRFRTEIETCKRQRIDAELQLTESHKKEVSELNDTLKEKETLLQNLTTQLQSKQNELDTLTNANGQLKHHYETETKRLREQLDEKQSLLEIQIDEMSSLQGQIDRRDVKISQLTDELDASEEDLAKSRRSFEKETKDFSDLTLKMENEFSSLNRQLSKESEINMEKTSQLESLERELEGRAKELEELRKEKQQQLLHTDELETDVAKLLAKLENSESEIELTKEMLEDNQVQMRTQLQKIEEMKRHHKKEIQDLLEDKEKELDSIHKTELDDLKRNSQIELEELKAHHRNDLQQLLKAKEKETADMNLHHTKEMEELQKRSIKDAKELESRHSEELEALVKEKEKEVKELKASHKKQLDDLYLEKDKQLNSAQSKHLEEMDELEKSLESQRQRQIQKLTEKHREDLNDMDDEIKNGQEANQKLEKRIAESAKQRELENIELNARHAKELDRMKEIHEKEMKTVQSELSRSHESVEELRRRISEIEIKHSEKIKNLSDKHSQTVGELKLAVETRNDEKLQKLTAKHETVLNEMHDEVTKLHTVSTELKRKISEGENQRQKERNEAEVRRAKELKELRLTFERQNEEHIQSISRKHEQTVNEMNDKMKKYQKQIEELKQTIAETERQRDRAMREASVSHEREKDMLKSALNVESERHLEKIVRGHRQDIENVQKELARSEDAAKELESRYKRELREKVKEMNEAGAKHARELETLRAFLQDENEEQFNKLSGKYEQKFCALREELEKNNSRNRETEEKQLRKTEDAKNFLNEVMLKNSHQLDDAITDLKRQHAQELQEKLYQYESNTRKLQEELHRQQQAVMKEKECGEERLRELISKHSGEVRELKATHQRYLDEAADNYRGEMGDLRRELCKSQDILKDLNAEHSRELAQLREELKHRNVAVHDNIPAATDSVSVKLETQNQSGPLPSKSFQEAWKLERQCLLTEISVFQNLLKELGNSDESKDSESMDWRTDILKAFHDVLTRQVNRTTVSEINLLVISKNSSQELNALLQTNLTELEQFYSQGLDQILAVDRKSMLDEIEVLRQQLALLQQELLDDNKNLTDKLNGLELRFKKRQKRLKNQLNAAEAQLSQEHEMRSELQSTIDAGRLYIEQLKDELNREKESAEQLKGKLSQLELKLDGSEDALTEEQMKLIDERVLSGQTAVKPTDKLFQNDHDYGHISDIVERLKTELVEEKEAHLQTKCDLAWEHNQRNDLEKKIKSLWEKIGSLESDGDLEVMQETDLHKEDLALQDDFYYSMRREELLVRCEQLQRLVAKYWDDLSKCSILSRDTCTLNEELMSIYQSLDSLVRNEDQMDNFRISLSSRLMALRKRYLKAEEHLSSLVYQKTYLLLLIGGFQDGERETLAAIARLGIDAAPAIRIRSSRLPVPLMRFRKAVQAVIAVIRLQHLAKRWGRFHGDALKQMNSVSTWKTLTSGIGTGGEYQSFSSLPVMSFDSSLASVGIEKSISNRHHRSRSPTCSLRAANSRTAPRAFDDNIMTRSCDFGSDRLSLIYSHYPRSPSRSSAKRCCMDESECIGRQRLSKRTQSADLARSRKTPIRPKSTYLW